MEQTSSSLVNDTEVESGTKYFNTIPLVTQEKILIEFKPLREPNPNRDEDYSPLFDCIMANILEQLRIHCNEHWFAVWSGGMFPERASQMALRAFEQYLERHIAPEMKHLSDERDRYKAALQSILESEHLNSGIQVIAEDALGIENKVG